VCNLFFFLFFLKSWLISGTAAVASVSDYIQSVIPPDQSFDQNYAGIFRFRFWRFGQWIEVVVDDFLPVDANGRLIYCHNERDKNEMFGPLLEKAYAKINLCYENLDGGFPMTAMVDMTGGVHESFDIKQRSDALFVNFKKTKLPNVYLEFNLEKNFYL
jgi:hypothetical protein